MFPYIDLSIPGWTLEYDLLCLAWLANKVHRNSHIVEIGSFCGRSTSVLLNNSNQCTIHIVDTFKAIPLVFNNQQEKYFLILLGDIEKFKSLPITTELESWIEIFNDYVGKHSNLIINVGLSGEFIPPPNTSIAFIDGHHGGDVPLNDIKLFLDDEECLIIVDDYDIRSHPDVVKGVNIAHHNNRRSVYMAPHSRFNFLLPKTGPMLDNMIKFIDWTNKYKTIDEIYTFFKTID